MDVKGFFEGRFDQFGDSHRALDWSEEGQKVRFRVLSEVGDLGNAHVLDLGSGLGHLYEYLKARHPDIRYTGYDFSERFVRHAQSKCPDATFEVHDVFREEISAKFDFVLCSGIHNLETGSNDADMVRLLANAWNAARTALAFNMLSTQSDYVTQGRHHYDSVRMTTEALRLTPYIVLRHDYMPHDFTLYLYRTPQARGPR